jgi:hypothetical protein
MHYLVSFPLIHLPENNQSVIDILDFGLQQSGYYDMIIVIFCFSTTQKSIIPKIYSFEII